MPNIIICQLCGEEVYTGRMERHMDKDHNPELDRELELIGQCIDQGVPYEQILEVVYGATF